MIISDGIALLAPVPEMHLTSGLEKLRKQKLPFLAFGAGKTGKDSRAPMRFLQEFKHFDNDLGHSHAALLIYASMDDEYPKPPYEITWSAIYVGHEVAGRDGLFPTIDPWECRPPTCNNNYDSEPATEQFVLYWKIQALTQLPEPLHIDIGRLDRTQLFNNASPPHRWPLAPERLDGSDWWAIRDFMKSNELPE